MGLREKQKSSRRKRIASAAKKIFRETGFDKARMEAIAEEADVSVATVYNYFSTKSDLLLELFLEADLAISSDIERLTATPPDDPVEGITRIFCTVTHRSWDQLGRENWQHVVAHSILQGDSLLGARYHDVNRLLRERLTRFLEVLRDRGRLPAETDCGALGRVLFRLEGMLYIEFLSDETITFEDYERQLREDVGLVIRGVVGHFASPDRSR